MMFEKSGAAWLLLLHCLASEFGHVRWAKCFLCATATECIGKMRGRNGSRNLT